MTPETGLTDHLMRKQHIIAQRRVELKKTILLNQTASYCSNQVMRVHLHTFLFYYAIFRIGKLIRLSLAIVQKAERYSQKFVKSYSFYM